MTIGPRHWAVAGGLSLAAHLVAFAFAASRPETISIERSAGNPGDVWGVEMQAIADTVEPIDAAADAAEEVEAAEEVAEPPAERAEDVAAADPAARPADVEEPASDVPPETAEAPAVEEAVPAGTARLAGEPVLPAVADEVEQAEEAATPRSVRAAETAAGEAEAAEEVDTAALPEAREAQEVTATDVTTPVPPVRPPDVPRVEAPPPQPQRQPEPRRERRPDPPRQSARQSPPASAPAGRQAGNAGERRTQAGTADASNYAGRVAAHLQRYKRYPREAARQRLAGTATLTFTISANGGVQTARLSRGTGHQPLDAEAMAMVRRAAPFPRIPGSLGRSSMTFTVPVRFTPR